MEELIKLSKEILKKDFVICKTGSSVLVKVFENDKVTEEHKFQI